MKWEYIIAIALLAVIGILGIQTVRLDKEKKLRETAENNVKAYSRDLSNAKAEQIAFKLTIDQLEYFKDSIFTELDNTRKELKVKDKELKALQYISSNFVKKDTITFHDTIFNDIDFHVDTLIEDSWYSVQLGLHYPSLIAVKPEFKSEKHIVVFSKKETVNPPKKFFLFRLFQRKHRVLNINVVEKNPHVDNQQSKYVEIID